MKVLVGWKGDVATMDLMGLSIWAALFCNSALIMVIALSRNEILHGSGLQLTYMSLVNICLKSGYEHSLVRGGSDPWLRMGAITGFRRRRRVAVQ